MMLKIKGNARAWQFKGDMFSAVDIIRAMDRPEDVTYEHVAGRLRIYDPVSDTEKVAEYGDWIVVTEGSRVLIYAADAFVFAFKEAAA